MPDHTLIGLPAGVGDGQSAALYAEVCRLGRELLAASAESARLRAAVERHQDTRRGCGDFTWVDEELWDALKPPKDAAPAETPWCPHGFYRANCGRCLDDAEGVRHPEKGA